MGAMQTIREVEAKAALNDFCGENPEWAASFAPGLITAKRKDGACITYQPSFMDEVPGSFSAHRAGGKMIRTARNQQKEFTTPAEAAKAIG